MLSAEERKAWEIEVEWCEKQLLECDPCLSPARSITDPVFDRWRSILAVAAHLRELEGNYDRLLQWNQQHGDPFELRTRINYLECQKKALQQVNEELEGKLCRAKEALRVYANEAEWQCDVVDIGVGSQPIPGTEHIFQIGPTLAKQALSSSAPCPHADRAEKAEGEAKRLREVYQTGLILRECGNCGEWHNNWRHFIDALDMAKAEYAQEEELRRRAEKEG